MEACWGGEWSRLVGQLKSPPEPLRSIGVDDAAECTDAPAASESPCGHCASAQQPKGEGPRLGTGMGSGQGAGR